jgi:hypothetical protein
MNNWREIRRTAGVSLHRASANAGVTPTTARAFELGGPQAISDQRKRDALVRVYEAFDRTSPSSPPHAA